MIGSELVLMLILRRREPTEIKGCTTFRAFGSQSVIPCLVYIVSETFLAVNMTWYEVELKVTPWVDGNAYHMECRQAL